MNEEIKMKCIRCDRCRKGMNENHLHNTGDVFDPLSLYLTCISDEDTIETNNTIPMHTFSDKEITNNNFLSLSPYLWPRDRQRTNDNNHIVINSRRSVTLATTWVSYVLEGQADSLILTRGRESAKPLWTGKYQEVTRRRVLWGNYIRFISI